MKLTKTICNATYQFVNREGRLEEVSVPKGFNCHGAILWMYDKIWESNPSIIIYNEENAQTFSYINSLIWVLEDIYVNSDDAWVNLPLN